MTDKSPIKLNKLEMEIMRIFWGKKEASVRDVFRVLNKVREIAYTTIMTTMHKMEKKGILTHRVEERKFIYKSLVTEDMVKLNVLNEIVNQIFAGSPLDMVATLIKLKKVSLEELESIVKQVKEKKKKK